MVTVILPNPVFVVFSWTFTFLCNPLIAPTPPTDTVEKLVLHTFTYPDRDASPHHCPKGTTSHVLIMLSVRAQPGDRNDTNDMNGECLTERIID